MPAVATITGGGVLTAQNLRDLNNNFAALAAGFTPGNVIWCWPSFPTPANPVGQAADGSLQRPYTDLASAYGAGRTGKNDVIMLVGNGAASGTARINSAFTWAKDALHLVGVCSPVLLSQRARMAPSSGTTAFAAFFAVSGNGCAFQNLQWFQGFTTGTTSQICVTVTGSRNYFSHCHIAGMGDNESAQSAGSRSLKISTGGENVFEDCTIGVDTITRTQANASVEFAGATTRNTFRRCYFPFMTSAAGVLGILGTGNGCCDRSQIFHDCIFDNAIKSTSTQMTVLGSFTTASPGGMVIFKGCASVGATKFGDTNFLANSFIDMSAVSAAAGGLMVAPS